MHADNWQTSRIGELETERMELVERVQALGENLGSMKQSAAQAGTMARLEVVRSMLAELDDTIPSGYDRGMLAAKFSKLAQDWSKVAVSARNSEADEAIALMREQMREDQSLQRFGGL